MKVEIIRADTMASLEDETRRPICAAEAAASASATEAATLLLFAAMRAGIVPSITLARALAAAAETAVSHNEHTKY